MEDISENYIEKPFGEADLSAVDKKVKLRTSDNAVFPVSWMLC